MLSKDFCFQSPPVTKLYEHSGGYCRIYVCWLSYANPCIVDIYQKMPKYMHNILSCTKLLPSGMALCCRLSSEGRQRSIYKKHQKQLRKKKKLHHGTSKTFNFFAIRYKLSCWNCSLSLWRVARGSKLMFLELIHGLFIT